MNTPPHPRGWGGVLEVRHADADCVDVVVRNLRVQDKHLSYRKTCLSPAGAPLAPIGSLAICLH